MKYWLSTLWMLVFVSLCNLGCTSPTLPDKESSSKIIQNCIIENGKMDGGNMIEIHQFNIRQITTGNTPNSARINFQIDFTRYPTSGLDPERYQGEPTRQTEDHQAVLIQEKEKWRVQDISLR